MKIKIDQIELDKLSEDHYNRGFNDAVDMLQAQRKRKKRVGEMWRVALLLNYLSDEGRKK